MHFVSSVGVDKMALTDETKKAFERYHGVSTEVVSRTGYSPKASVANYSDTRNVSDAERKDLANLLILSAW